MSQMSIDEAIGRRVTRMSLGRYRDAQIIEDKCPKCGSQIVCVYDDLGATDYYDNYAHICLNSDCGFVLHHESFTCNVGGRASAPMGTEIDPVSRTEVVKEVCWFCRRPIRMTW